MNDSCDAIQDRLVKLHLTGIPITDDPDVRAHLENCSTCRIYHDFLDHDHRALEVYARSLDTYVDEVKQRLHRQIEHTGPDSPNRITSPWWAVAAIIPLVAGLILLLHSGPSASEDRPGPDPGANPMRPTAVQSPALNGQAVKPIEPPPPDTGDVMPDAESMRAATPLPVGPPTDPDANGVLLEMAETSEEPHEPKAEADVEDFGTVVTSRGDPVSGIQVFLCQGVMDVSVNNGTPSSAAYAVRTDGDGRFLMDSGRPVKYLVAVGMEGIAQIDYDDFQKQRVIPLEAWVTVKGDLMIDAQPAVGYMLEALTRDALESRGGVDAYSQCRTDSQGHFEFNRIPPGHMILYGREYEVRAGRTYDLHLGVGGQSVTGQFVLPGYTDRIGVLRGESIITHVISLDSDPYAVDTSLLTEPGESRVFQQVSSNDMGRFHVDHLEPGHYALAGSSSGSGNPEGQKHAYRVWHEFIVPAPSEEIQGDIPIDIGNVELMPGDLMVGDEAPDFDLWDLDGTPYSLSSVADKLVLLSFYRTDDLKGPIPGIRELYDIQTQFGAVTSFVLIGMLASDSSPQKNLEIVYAAGITWPHVQVGRNGLNRTQIEYDVLDTPWPRNILISPNGTILAMGLQGEALLEAIATHLP
jgi:hypothetical protein